MSRGRTIALLAAAGALAGALYFAAWRPVTEWRAASFEALAKAQGEQATLTDRIASLQARRLSLTREELPIELWAAPNLGRANALVQEAFVAIGRETGLEIQTMTPRDGVELPSASAVGFRMEAEATWDVVVAFLDGVEVHQPPLLIERAVLRRLNRPGERAEQPLVSAQFDVLAPVSLADGAQ